MIFTHYRYGFCSSGNAFVEDIVCDRLIEPGGYLRFFDWNIEGWYHKSTQKF
jgi:hypothetical protein